MDWSTKTVVVTGGAGFLGRFVVDRLGAVGCTRVIVPRSREYDLRDREAVGRLLGESRPDVVIHLAAVVGGIGANRANPGRFFYDNAVMGLEVMEQCRLAGVPKLVAIGTICAYPKFTTVPFAEADLWNGYPEETNAPYGLAKKMSLVQGQAYRAQYGFNAIYLLPTNLYGPGDNFDLETGHVIPSIIRKCVEAKEGNHPDMVLWGDGTPTREFLYVADAAEAIVLAAERYDGAEPINLGVGEETSIRELVELVASEVGFTGRLVWDTTKPNGQPRRCVDVSRARELIGFQARHQLRDGIPKTVAAFLASRTPSVLGSPAHNIQDDLGLVDRVFGSEPST